MDYVYDKKRTTSRTLYIIISHTLLVINITHTEMSEEVVPTDSRDTPR